MSAVSGLLTLIRRREPSRPVGLARIAVGAAAVVKLVDVAPTLWAATAPQMFLTPYSTALPRPTPGWVLALTVLWAISALLFTAGWGGRKPGGVLCAALVAVLVLDRQLYSNHLYLLVLLVGLLTLADASRAVSLDARQGHRRESGIPGWPVTLLRWQLTILYFFAAASKVNPTFLTGAVLAEQLPHFAGHGELLKLASWLGLALETWLAVGLWHPRTKRATALLGIAFHLTILAFMQPKAELLVFGLESLALYPLFFPRKSPE